MDEAQLAVDRGGRIRLKTALEYRDGLIIALAALVCPRRRSMAGITIAKNIVRYGAAWTLRFDDHQTKNGRAIEFPLPSDLAPYLAIYVAKFRPAFKDAARHDALWASAKGCPLTRQAIYEAVYRRTKAEFGVAMHLHLFRDAVATSLSVNVPQQVRAAADLLGHASFTPTQRHYIRAQGITAGRLLAQAIRKKSLV
jgi:integrase/recombinase XerD